MADKKIIAVLGATGAQGGGLVRAILAEKSGEFVARAVTRKVDSEKAQALAAQGVEVVAADLDDPKSLEKAFAGAYGVFGVTNFWEHFSAEKETNQAKNIAKAAKAASVQHVIWSTLEDTRKWIPLDDDRMPTLHGKYKCPHFDAKGEADATFRELGVPTTFLLTSFYWDNLIHFGLGAKRGPDGKAALTLPMGDAKLPGIAASDIGKFAFAILKDGKGNVGKTIGVAGEHVTGAQMAEKISRVVGEPVAYNAVPPAVFRSFGFPGADDMGNMFQFKHDFTDYYVGARDIPAAKKLVPDLLDMDGWIEQNKAQIKVT